MTTRNYKIQNCARIIPWRKDPTGHRCWQIELEQRRLAYHGARPYTHCLGGGRVPTGSMRATLTGNCRSMSIRTTFALCYQRSLSLQTIWGVASFCFLPTALDSTDKLKWVRLNGHVMNYISVSTRCVMLSFSLIRISSFLRYRELLILLEKCNIFFFSVCGRRTFYPMWIP